MGYAVHYRDAAGAAKLEDVESLDVALERVEQLRNEDGASDVRVFREVPIEVRTYYKVVAVEGKHDVEPPPGAMPLSPPPAVVHKAVVASDAAPAKDETGEQPEESSSDSARRSSLFNRA